MSDEKDRIKPLRYQLETRAGRVTARQICGVEGISTPFRFEIWARIDSHNELLDPDEHVGDVACLLLHREGEHLRRIRGLITHATVEATAAGEPELYAVLEPRLIRARYRKDSRVFRDLTVPDIVSLVLERADVPFVKRLAGSYRERPYCVQYQETDLDFLSRLLEQEGIFYYFRDDSEGLSGDGEEPALLVLGDNAEAYEPIGGEPKLPFAAGKGLETTTEVIYELGGRAKLAPSKVTLRDFNAERPGLDLTVSAAGPSKVGGDYYHYPGKYELPAEGQRLADIMAEAMACDAAAVTGLSSCGRLSAGHVFDLEDGPAPAPDGRYVLTKLEHRWERGASVYTVDLEMLPGDVIFRPLHRTPRPAQESIMTGFVTGPAGTDIYCNELGHVKVHFPWDREQARDEHASHWVPVMQDNTGTSTGIPRRTWEVAVQYAEGDPDRPVILGRLYNGADPFPEPLPGGKTRTALKSLTSPPDPVVRAPFGVGLGPGVGGAGTAIAANEIFFEDATGSELIYLQAQKDLNAVIANDKTENVLYDEINEVGGDEVIEIGHDHVMVVGGDRGLEVQGDQKLTVDGNREVKVGENEKIDIGGDRGTKIGQIHTRRIATTDSTAAQSQTELIGSLNLEASLKPNTIKAGMVESLTVRGALIEGAVGNKQESVKTARIETIGGLLMTGTLSEQSFKVKATRTTNVAGAWLTSASKNVTYKGKATLTASIGIVGELFSPASVGVQTASSSVTLTNSTISVVGNEVQIKAATIELFNAETQNNP